MMVAAVVMACEQEAKPAAPSPVSGQSQSTGFLTNRFVQLNCQLDVPTHSAPAAAVVFGHGSGMATKNSCRAFGLADGFPARGYATLCFNKRGVG